MSINGPSEITAKASRGRPDGGLPALLHAVAIIAVVVGAVGSVGLMLRAGYRNPKGATCARLEANVYIMTAPSQEHDNLIRAVHH